MVRLRLRGGGAYPSQLVTITPTFFKQHRDCHLRDWAGPTNRPKTETRLRLYFMMYNMSDARNPNH